MAKKSEERLANMAQNNPGEGPDIGEVTKVVRKTKEKQIEVVNCDRLNIRVAPSATAKVSTVVKVGTKGIHHFRAERIPFERRRGQAVSRHSGE